MTDVEWRQFEVHFPTLAAGSRGAAIVRSQAVLRRVPAGEVLYHDGDECTYLPMLLTGEIILNKYAENGRTIALYRIEGGESCILSTLSILTRRAFPAEALADKPSTMLLVPATAVRTLIDTERAWRDFAFAIYQERVAELISLLEEIAFARLDVRLAEYLQRDARGVPPTVTRTHQEIAGELGSSREVVSRLLKEWERRAAVELHRGKIVILDLGFLARVGGAR